MLARSENLVNVKILITQLQKKDKNSSRLFMVENESLNSAIRLADY